MAVTTDRDEIMRLVEEELEGLGHWGDRVRQADSPQVVPHNFAAPFCLIGDGQTLFENMASAQSFMTFNVWIGIYANLFEPAWSLAGHGEHLGIRKMQDKIRDHFNRNTLGGKIHMAVITNHDGPVPVEAAASDGEDRAFLVSLSNLEVKVYTAG